MSTSLNPKIPKNFDKYVSFAKIQVDQGLSKSWRNMFEDGESKNRPNYTKLSRRLNNFLERYLMKDVVSYKFDRQENMYFFL